MKDYLILFGFVQLVCIAIAAYIFKLVLGMSAIKQNMQSQTANLKNIRRILTEIAKKQGMTENDIEAIIKQSAQETLYL